MPDLDSLLRQLVDDERTAALARTLRAQRHARLHIAPLISAARTATIAALAAQHDRPILYIVDSAEVATRAISDLSQWLGDGVVRSYPSSDAMAYERMSSSNTAVAARLQVIQRIADERTSGRAGERVSLQDEVSPVHPCTRVPVQVIVAPVRALMQPTLTPEEWRAAAMTLRQGAEHSAEALIARWVALGYRPAPTVEEPGEINRRGGILDIFPPGDAAPLRIEFFGDEIDSMRRFDPLTQRSQTRVREVVIGPPGETPFWQQDAALERLRALPAETLRREAREEWEADIERLAHGERFEGRGLYAPFFRPSAATLLDHLPDGAVVVFSELTLLAQHVAELHRQAEQRRAVLVESGELPPTYPRPYLLLEEALAQAAHVAQVDFSNNELGVGDQGSGVGADFLPSDAQPLTAPTFVPTELFGGQLRNLVDDIVTRLNAGEQVVVVTPQAARIQELVEEGGRGPGTGDREQHSLGETNGYTSVPSNLSAVTFVHGTLDEGWRAPGLRLTLYTDSEIFGFRQRRVTSARARKSDKSAEERAAFLRGLKPGDYVVHIEHGIAVFDGLIRRTVGAIKREYLNLRYADGDRLYVPVDQVDRVSRYIGAGEAVPHLTRLGTQEWERAKRKARAAVQDLADELIKLYAERQTSEGYAFSADGEWQRQLEDSFPYAETDDQLRAIAEVKHDMENPHPMDRLICGDVGFGKTEVALRAAFKAVQDGKQVAVLVPTTVLAQQHYDTFSRRMAAFPLRVELLSRFRSAKEQGQTVERLARGEVDIIVGTHRLLSKDVRFKDLGLLVVDEEQRFGVRHKERIKHMRANVDVLTLSATPIPRTLHMALAGIRDMSVIDTPPQDRLPIKSYMLPYDDRLVREAILREQDRGGQIFYVHNRVQSIYYVADKLKRLVPEVEVVVGHGQMEEGALEKVMFKFVEGQADVLVSTTIIENGLDVPNANTIIVDDATKYGLAQLYQLRGRVGRSVQRAYAYLFYPNDHRMTADAQERLLAIQEATELGAGLRIAMRDLEIRGAGNLLGAEQSGQIAAVGFDLYTRLLQQAVAARKQQFREQGTGDRGQGTGDRGQEPNGQARAANAARPLTPDPRPLPNVPRPLRVDERVLISPLVTLDLPIDAYLPPDFIPEEQVRLAVYQRLAEAQTPAQVRELRQELRDRFGELPDPAECLLTWLMIKALALRAGVSSIVTTDEEFIVRLPEGGSADRELLRRRFVRDKAVKIGPQFARLDRRMVQGEWVPALTGILEVLGKARGDA